MPTSVYTWQKQQRQKLIHVQSHQTLYYINNKMQWVKRRWVHVQHLDLLSFPFLRSLQFLKLNLKVDAWHHYEMQDNNFFEREKLRFFNFTRILERWQILVECVLVCCLFCSRYPKVNERLWQWCKCAEFPGSGEVVLRFGPFSRSN